MRHQKAFLTFAISMLMKRYKWRKALESPLFSTDTQMMYIDVICDGSSTQIFFT